MLQHEADLCRRECPFVIKPKIQRPATAATQEGEEMETDIEGNIFSKMQDVQFYSVLL